MIIVKLLEKNLEEKYIFAKVEKIRTKMQIPGLPIIYTRITKYKTKKVFLNKNN